MTNQQPLHLGSSYDDMVANAGLIIILAKA
jgi:hypothetical protein